MNCAAARHAILDADLTELTGGSGSELSRHLETCPACRAAAALVVEAERGLAAWLDAARPRGEADQALARAAAAHRRRARVRRAGAAGSLLAAAAAVVLLLLPHAPPPAAPALGAALPEAGRFSVTASPSRDVVVMHTSNPKIIVVWYLPSRRTS
jgi:anti-sigma factor RsiW